MNILAPKTFASTMVAAEQNEAMQFVNGVIQGSSDVIAYQNEVIDPNREEILLGRIKDKKTNHSIEIYCADGTRQQCNKIAFYRVIGEMREGHPFSSVDSIDKINFEYQPNEISILPVTEGLFEIKNGADEIGVIWLIPPFIVVPAITFTIDVLILPFREIFRGKPGGLHRAEKALYKALTSGKTVMVNSKQFNRLLERL